MTDWKTTDKCIGDKVIPGTRGEMTCGNGTQTWIREPVTEAQHGGAACSTMETQERRSFIDRHCTYEGYNNIRARSDPSRRFQNHGKGPY